MLEELDCGAPGVRGAATGRFGPSWRGSGGAASGLCGPRQWLGASRPASLRLVSSLWGRYNPEEEPCDPKSALLDVIVAAGTIFSPCAFTLSSFFQGSLR